RWYQITARRVGDLLIATSEDISAKKHIEHELQGSRDSLQKQKSLLQKCLDAMPQLVWISDGAGNIDFFNDRWYEYTGLTQHESKSYHSMSTATVHPSQVRETLSKWQQCLRDGIPFSGETLLRDAAGNYRWHLEMIVPIRDEQGAIHMWIGTLTDVHEQFVSEKRLKENAHLLETVFNAFTSAVQVFDCVYNESSAVVDFRWRYVNHKTNEYAGRGDLIGKQLSEVFPAVVSSGILTKMKEVCRTGKESSFESPFLVGGATRWFHTVVVKIEDGLVVNNLDITEQRAARDKIFLQQRIDQQVAKIANTGNWEWNIQTDKVTCGSNLYALLEINHESTRATLDDFIKAIHPDDLVLIREASEMAREIAEGPFPSVEFRVMKKDGGVRYLRSASEIVKREDQRFAIGTIRDVTEEIRMRDALAERVRFSETIVESSVDRILAFDKALRCLAWNNKCEIYYGIKKEDILGKVITEIFPAFIEREEFMENIRRVLEGEVVYTPLIEGGYHPGHYEAFLVPLKDEHNMVYGAVVTLHDLTEKVKARQELEMLNESLNKKNFELKAMNEELASFAFIASHDLREPLRKIHVFSEALTQSEAANLSEAGKNYFNRILSAVQRMNGLIDNILSFSRISADTRNVERFDLNEAMAAAKDELDSLIREKQARVECGILPSFTGDKQQFIKLLVNMVGNALKFQKQGNIPWVKISADYIVGSAIDHPSVIAHKKYLHLAVADNGIGFEQEYAGRIFKMFQRLHGMFEFPGNGMGLAICKKVVDNHQGFIITQGEPGVGAVFNCYFPLAD
ncbi:MAG TPA: PAS domain-containing protein, partial [Ohtaekwangia sp.]|nr:PAS domain-containing protein [Ohtaekwangia sp.]